ncbi:MAG: response regulator transcription factor [Saprospiraceae bacterium]|nr:response regulator transcription factor [Saprospiraceae bacterium]
MFMVRWIKYWPVLLALPVMAWLISPSPESSPRQTSERVNLALRRTADGLLRLSGDSTSRIPAIEQTAANVWQVQLEKPFSYEQLPAILQASLDQYGVRESYEVAVRRCEDAVIDLGYHQLDFLENEDGFVPCGGRAAPEGCHYIELRFVEPATGNALAVKIGLALLALSGLLLYWLVRRKRYAGPVETMPEAAEPDWLVFGQSRLDVSNQVLECGGHRQQLTFREAKLLRLLASHTDRLLEREEIIRQVWADEGVLVGRSVDMFVSRLRKKLAPDPSVAIVAVHGVGYRLETGR